MISGFSRYDFLTGGIVAVVSILMVFLILVLIIFLTELVAKAMGNDEKEETVAEAPVTPAVSHLDLNDEDATVAALVASIDYRNKTKKNIRVVSIREVK